VTEVYGDYFGLSRDILQGYFASILHRKAGHGDTIGNGRWIGGRSFEKSSHILVELPDKRAF